MLGEGVCHEDSPLTPLAVLGPWLGSQAYLFLAGISWKEKVADLRLKMAERNIVWFVVTALDEVACECSAFPVRARCLILPLGLCASMPLSFLSGRGLGGGGYARGCYQIGTDASEDKEQSTGSGGEGYGLVWCHSQRRVHRGPF